MLCSVDNSEAAFLNEDYPGTRWRYQRQALISLCRHYALQSGDSKEAAHTISRQPRAGMSSMCVVAAGSARLQHPPCPVRESDAALASLLNLEMAEGLHSQYQKALLLAAVNFTLFRHTSMYFGQHVWKDCNGNVNLRDETCSSCSPCQCHFTLHGEVISIFWAMLGTLGCFRLLSDLIRCAAAGSPTAHVGPHHRICRRPLQTRAERCARPHQQASRRPPRHHHACISCRGRQHCSAGAAVVSGWSQWRTISSSRHASQHAPCMQCQPCGGVSGFRPPHQQQRSLSSLCLRISGALGGMQPHSM